MAQGEFRITEYPPGALAGEGAVFVWTADRNNVDPFDTRKEAGARAAPIGPWKLGGKLRTVRTDYPGARLPSEQVLGSNHKPFSWAGRWDDRYNHQGFAVEEMRRFEAMCKRGNPVKVEYQVHAYWGIITDWDFQFRRKWDIGYAFEVSVHSRDGEEKMDRSPEAPEQPDRALDDINILAAATADAHSNKPAWATSSPIVANTSAALARVSERINAVADSLSTSQGVLKPISDAKNLALQMRALQGDCSNVVLQLVAARSDLDMGIRTAKSVLDFEAWTRNTRSLMRLTMGRSKSAADQMDRRDIPKAKAVYRPFKGESLYGVSRKAYGTPNGWKSIMRANHLTSLTMQGTEVLVIPEMGQVG